jgi:hypothetical protein
VTKKELDCLKTWFKNYVDSFHFGDEKDLRNITLKEKHTYNVCRNITLIAKDLSLDDGGLLLAESIGLFHDVGRFKQYEKYRTFRDSVSVNHAALGVEILSDNKVLRSLPEKEQNMILSSIKFHNVLAMPDLPDDEALLFLKLIRDADKLDIWRVFIEYYESAEEERASAAGLGLPDSSGYSDKVLSHIFDKKVAPLSSLRTLNDFKLTQLSWVFDLNFDETFRLLLERKYIDKIIGTLPQTNEILKASFLLRDYVELRLREKISGLNR